MRGFLSVTAAMAVLWALSAPAAAGGSACVPGRFPVAVDIGHTVQAPGAMSARGIPEFIFNMALGRDTVAALQDAGFPAERIIVEGKGRQQISRRIERANTEKAALLISIHHDSVQEHYLEEWSFAGRDLRYSDRFAGYSIFVSRANRAFKDSLSFAKILGRSLTKAGFGFSTHHAENIPGENREILDRRHGVFEFRDLRVLKDVESPAVLLEAGVIVNRNEELEAASPERRRIMSAAIVDAVKQFCAKHGEKLALQ